MSSCLPFRVYNSRAVGKITHLLLIVKSHQSIRQLEIPPPPRDGSRVLHRDPPAQEHAIPSQTALPASLRACEASRPPPLHRLALQFFFRPRDLFEPALLLKSLLPEPPRYLRAPLYIPLPPLDPLTRAPILLRAFFLLSRDPHCHRALKLGLKRRLSEFCKECCNDQSQAASPGTQ